MLKLQVNDLVKILTVNEVGECKDGRTFVRCSALSFFGDDDNATFMTLTAFGAVADMIADNHTGENMRRAMVSGRLEVTATKAKQKVKIDGVIKTIMVPDYHFQILADSVRFIDKNRIGETEADTDDDDVVEYETVDESEGEVEEIAATTGEVKIVDADEDKPRRTARDKAKNKKNSDPDAPTRKRK